MTSGQLAQLRARWLASARRWLRVYGAAAARGEVDAPGSAECRRLYSAWLRQGRPRPLAEWLRRMAGGAAGRGPGTG